MDTPDHELLADYAAPGVFTTLDADAAALADAAPDLASISSRADTGALAELREMLDGDERLRVPGDAVAAALAADAAAAG